MHTRSEYFSDIKVLKLNELPHNLRSEILELLTSMDEDKVVVYKLNYTPIRLQELFKELYKKECNRILGSIVFSGELYIVCLT